MSLMDHLVKQLLTNLEDADKGNPSLDEEVARALGVWKDVTYHPCFTESFDAAHRLIPKDCSSVLLLENLAKKSANLTLKRDGKLYVATAYGHSLALAICGACVRLKAEIDFNTAVETVLKETKV